MVNQKTVQEEQIHSKWVQGVVGYDRFVNDYYRKGIFDALTHMGIKYEWLTQPFSRDYLIDNVKTEGKTNEEIIKQKYEVAFPSFKNLSDYRNGMKYRQGIIDALKTHGLVYDWFKEGVEPDDVD